jgi:hypothetical protein
MVIKLRLVRKVGHVVHIRTITGWRNQPEGPVGRWEIAIKVDEIEIMSKNVNWFN